jgi:GH15 family glucan-1,4-alpha-glucosidase
MSSPIEDYALIADGETAALVNRNGSVDWLCWPRFDDDACFAALLGTDENGCWSIAPAAAVMAIRRRYQDDTLVIETTFETAGGSIRLIDFMPMREGASSLVRIVEGVEGSVAVRFEMRLRFDYGALPPWSEAEGNGFVARLGPDLVALQAPLPITVHAHLAEADFDVAAGQRHAFVLRCGPAHLPVPEAIDAEQALASTQADWRAWIAKFDTSRTEWPDVVKRSLITLRAMIHRPSGGLVAAPTTSLPEAPGGAMNWDYRYCWLRDSTFTLGALLNAGYREEATAWRDWLLRAIAGSPERVRIMYRVDGARHLAEWSVDTLRGYRYANPVRIGNAASTQHQIDVFGELLDCLHLARLGEVPPSGQERRVTIMIVEHLEKVWNTEGSGVWESRAEPRQYTYSKVMAWVGVDRVLRLLEGQGASGDRDRPLAERLTTLRRTIHEEVCREGWNEGLGSFTQHYGGQAIDASLLLMPLVGFLPADDRRVAATIETIRRELSEDGLIRRTKAPASGPVEGVFLACSCWMADCLAMQGRREEARSQFERVLAVCNDVNLLSEEYNVPGRHLAGNFPQALTHLAVINTALGLCGPVLHRGGG